MIFDTHVHYDDEIFAEDLENIFEEFPQKGLGKVVDVAASIASIDAVYDLANKYDFMYCALGIHPSECEEMTDFVLEKIRARLHDPKVVAVGEIGLDYHWDEPDREIQKLWFEKQIALAQDEKMPIIIHSRDAAQDTMEILQRTDAGKYGGVVHCYSYSLELARELIKMGFYIGVGGVVTFKNARRLKEVVENISLDNIVLETDCPYMAPEPFRGKRNSSLYLPYVVTQIAQLKSVAEEEVIRRTQENAEAMYNLR